MLFIFSSIIAPIVVGCVIAYFKHTLEDRDNKK